MVRIAMGRSMDATQGLVGQWAACLTTFRRDGHPVDTPVNIVVKEGRVLFRTYASAWKCRRLERDPRVELAPCDWRGRKRGPAVVGRARRLQGEEDEAAAAAIDRAYPVFQRLLVRAGHRVLRYRTVHYEVVLDEQGDR